MPDALIVVAVVVGTLLVIGTTTDQLTRLFASPENRATWKAERARSR